MNNITTYNNIDETVSEETKRVLNDFNTKLSPEKIEEVEEKVRRRIRVLLSI
jgi:hypothetical protein